MDEKLQLGECEFFGGVIRLPKQNGHRRLNAEGSARKKNKQKPEIMKTLLSLFVISMMLFTENANAAGFESAVPLPPGPWIRIELIFHRPSTDCKTGFGFCFDITAGIERPVAGNDQTRCPVKAQLNERNQLIVEITADALASYENGSTLPYFKDKGSITIQDPYTLSPAACRALGSATPIMIKPGNYPVSFASGVYTVILQL